MTIDPKLLEAPPMKQIERYSQGLAEANHRIITLEVVNAQLQDQVSILSRRLMELAQQHSDGDLGDIPE